MTIHGNFAPRAKHATTTMTEAAERQMKAFLVSVRDWAYGDRDGIGDAKVRLFARLCHLEAGAISRELSIAVYHFVIELLACLKQLVGGTWAMILQQWEHGDALVRMFGVPGRSPKRTSALAEQQGRAADAVSCTSAGP